MIGILEGKETAYCARCGQSFVLPRRLHSLVLPRPPLMDLGLKVISFSSQPTVILVALPDRFSEHVESVSGVFLQKESSASRKRVG